MEAAVTIPGRGILSEGEAGPSTTSGAVCYEMDFPRLIRQAIRLRADLFLASAYDWDEIKNMHARMSRLRAIENGMTIFRPAAGGISTAFDPSAGA